MTIDKRSINVLLAALEIEQQDLADAMGYRPGYVANVFNGCTPVSTTFRQAFGQAVSELLLGPNDESDRYPAGPLRELLRKRAQQAPSRSDFYADLGVSPGYWNKRISVPGELVDRICCALGVHLSALYSNDDIEVAS